MHSYLLLKQRKKHVFFVCVTDLFGLLTSRLCPFKSRDATGQNRRCGEHSCSELLPYFNPLNFLGNFLHQLLSLGLQCKLIALIKIYRQAGAQWGEFLIVSDVHVIMWVYVGKICQSFGWQSNDMPKKKFIPFCKHLKASKINDDFEKNTLVVSQHVGIWFPFYNIHTYPSNKTKDTIMLITFLPLCICFGFICGTHKFCTLNLIFSPIHNISSLKNSTCQIYEHLCAFPCLTTGF